MLEKADRWPSMRSSSKRSLVKTDSLRRCFLSTGSHETVDPGFSVTLGEHFCSVADFPDASREGVERPAVITEFGLALRLSLTVAKAGPTDGTITALGLA